ncbi:hypothetical protein [Pseudoflavonifractor sp. An85]|uniref:hypothetical protein n=1 Tax=Pseudoflavonifractor sp. An85 TaxID=1965661 RepID=UPI000B37DBF9|nr:hypothetical protein [Pseudoflavonifractor sp. An85]OUN20125.1 hypothetical protein B5G37_12860 [Pseudoflavonifractor sp. An85]
MLTKLLKYDFKSMFKLFLPLWGVLLVVSAINRLFFGSPMDTDHVVGLVNSLMVLLYVLLIVAVMVVTTVIIIVRFYQGLLKDEGYLMFTIPVHPWQLITSKLLSALVISLLSSVVAVVSVIIIASFDGMWEVLGQAMDLAVREVPNFIPMVILLVISFFVGLICSISQVYASMALGHLAGSHRVGFSVLAFIVLNMAWSTVSTIIGLFGYGDITSSLVTITAGSQATLNVDGFSNLMLLSTVWSIALNLVRCVVHFALTNYILSRRLNLE